jgi:4-amino-4-deoxy-L-arabinose transferase-like glycosyltransferase
MSKSLIAAAMFALALRLGFWAFGAGVVWPDPYRGADTPAYVDSAMNLVDHGTYASDFDNPDGFFSRPPAYSLFWAPFYWVLGEDHAYVAVALAQVMLDVISVCLVFAIVRLFGMTHRAGLIGALLYAVYPFTIVWTTVSLPDTLANFLTFAFVATLLGARERPGWWIGTGALYAACILTREYLGLLGVMVPIVAYHSVPAVKKALVVCMLFSASAVVVYAGWPLRNLIGHGELIVFRVAGSASPFYQADARAAIAWLSAWTNFPEEYTQMIMRKTRAIEFPSDVFADDAEREFAEDLALRARQCGGSFNAGKGVEPLANPCTDEVARGFEKLLASYKARHPIAYRLRVPMQNVRKILFKSSLVQPRSGTLARLAERLVFAFRTMLLALGIVAAFVYRRNVPLVAVFVSCLLIYLFMAFILRHVQMRYLLQADLLMLTLASVPLDRLVAAVARPVIKP